MTQRDVSGWLPNLLGPVTIQADGVALPSRTTINFKGGIATDNSGADSTDVQFGGAPLANSGTGTLNDISSSGASTIRFSGVAPTVTGIASGVGDRRLLVLATGGPLVLANESGSSVAANRIVTGTGANVTIANGSGALLVYDGTSSRWRLTGDGAGGGSVGGANTQVLFNDSGSETGDAGLTYDKTNDVLSVVGAVAIGSSVAATGNIRVGTTAGNGEFITFKYNGGSDYAILQMSGAAFYLGNSGFNARMDGNVVTIFSASDTQFYSNSAQKLYLASTGLQVGAGATDHGGGNGVVGIDNAGTDPTTNPTGGGILYASGGAGKWRGSSGTVTTFGPADPHCPTCGRDFAVEHQNDTLGEHLALCLPCLVDALRTAGIDTSTFTIADKRGATKAEWNAAHAAAKGRAKQPAPPLVGGNNASHS